MTVKNDADITNHSEIKNEKKPKTQIMIGK